jgi:alpha-beta hydrolase superfamily lysophospholipase
MLYNKKFVVNSGINPHWLSKDNMFVKRIFEDRFMIPLATIKMVKTLIALASALERKNDKVFINCPILFICSEKDKLTPINLAMNYFNKLQCKEKKFSFNESGKIKSPPRTHV